MALRLAAAADAAMASEDVLFDLVAGCVGEGAAIEFLAHVADSDLVDPELALERPWEVEIPDRPDRCHAFLEGVVEAVGARPTEDRWRSAWVLVTRSATTRGLDVAFVAGRQLARVRHPEWEPPEDSDLFEPILQGVGR